MLYLSCITRWQLRDFLCLAVLSKQTTTVTKPPTDAPKDAGIRECRLSRNVVRHCAWRPLSGLSNPLL
jgi:hypothetical protein